MIIKERMAKCFYYGSPLSRKNECDKCQTNKECACIEKTTHKLAFWEKTTDEFDKFYCGCHGWD